MRTPCGNCKRSHNNAESKRRCAANAIRQGDIAVQSRRRVEGEAKPVKKWRVSWTVLREATVHAADHESAIHAAMSLRDDEMYHGEASDMVAEVVDG